MADCSSWNLICKGLSASAQTVQDTVVSTWAGDVMDSLDKALRQAGSFWVKVPTPDVSTSGSAVTWAQSQTGWIAVYVAIGCLIAAGIHMAVTQRGEDLRRIAQGMLLLVIVSVAGVGIVQLLIDIADGTSSAILSAAVDTDSSNFMLKILTLDTFDMGNAGLVTVILMGLLGVLANLIQIGMMFIRSAMLILIVAVMPVVASAAIMDWGRAWLKKLCCWALAFIIMKPAAALIYALAIKLVEGDSYNIADDGELTTFILGVMMMVMAAFALPALVGFMVPVAGALGSSGGAGAALAGAGATGSMAVSAVSRTRGAGGPSGAPAASLAGPSGANAAAGSAGHRGPSGSAGLDGAGTDGTTGAGGSTGSSGASGTAGAAGVAGAAGSAGTAGSAGAAGAPGATGAAGTAGVAGASGSAGSAGASGAAIAAGPAGAAAAVALEGAKAASNTVTAATYEGASGAGEAHR